MVINPVTYTLPNIMDTARGHCLVGSIHIAKRGVEKSRDVMRPYKSNQNKLS